MRKRKVYLVADQVPTTIRPKRRPAPSFSRDVLAITILVAGLAAVATFGALGLSALIMEQLGLVVNRQIGLYLALLVGGLAGLVTAIGRVQAWDLAMGHQPQILELEETADEPELEAELVTQIQRPDGTLRLSKYGAFAGWRRRHWVRLAQMMLDHLDRKVSRDSLHATALWPNLTGPGKHHRYLYQDVAADLAWFGWLEDGQVTQAGEDWSTDILAGRDPGSG